MRYLHTLDPEELDDVLGVHENDKYNYFKNFSKNDVGIRIE